MKFSYKVLLGRRFRDWLQEYAEGMDYGLSDVTGELADRLELLEKEVTILRVEVGRLQNKPNHVDFV